MGYFFYKGKMYAEEVLVDRELDTESEFPISNRAVAEAVESLDADKISNPSSKALNSVLTWNGSEWVANAPRTPAARVRVDGVDVVDQSGTANIDGKADRTQLLRKITL